MDTSTVPNHSQQALPQSPGLGFFSVPALKQYLKQADILGLDYAPFLDTAGISQRVLSDNSGRITGAALQTLLGSLIVASQDPCFGLRSSVFVQPTTYSVVGYIALNCANLREILDNIPMFERIVSDAGVTTIEPREGYVLQRWDCRFPQGEIRRHLIENVLGSWQQYSLHHLGFPPADCILLEHPKPPSVDVQTYRTIFGCDVKFNQDCSGVRILEQSLELTVPEANPDLLGTLLGHATQIMREVDAGQRVSIRARNMLRLTLREGVIRREEIAARLDMSGRTLQRHLISEGTHYQQLLQQLRLEMAHHYLRNTALPIESIASSLGYSEARSFYRSFHQWTGQTPGDYRRTAVHTNAGPGQSDSRVVAN